MPFTFVLNCASSRPPSCCAAPLKVAENSSERFTPTSGRVVLIWLPCSLMDPLLTVAVPFAIKALDTHPAGSAVPENSVPIPGVRMISPSAVSEMYAPVPSVPR